MNNTYVKETEINELLGLYAERNVQFPNSPARQMGIDKLDSKRFWALFSQDIPLGAYSINFSCLESPRRILIPGDLYVLEAQRHQGIGLQLASHILQNCKSLGANRIRLYPDTKKIALFWKSKFGFEEVEENSTLDLIL